MREQFVVHNDEVYVIKELYDKDVMIVNEENKKLHSIIKEVREYIKNIPDDEFVESEHFTELLEILDKVNKEK